MDNNLFQFTPEKSDAQNNNEEKRNNVVRYLLEQTFSHYQNRQQAYDATLNIIGKRFIDSCLMERIPFDQLDRKIQGIVCVMKENMPCAAFTSEFEKFGIDMVFCDMSGPTSMHKGVHRSARTYNASEEVKEGDLVERVELKPCHWAGTYQKPNIQYNLQEVLENQVKEINLPADETERKKFILEYHEKVLREVSEDMSNFYPHNSCVDCFTDNDRLRIMACGHGICRANCDANGLRQWEKDWCPMCDKFFSLAQEGLKEEPEAGLGLTNLYIAALNGDTLQARIEIEKNARKHDVPIKSGLTPFWIAVKKRHYEVAEFILSKGVVNVNSVLKLNSKTVLFDLAEQVGLSDGVLKKMFEKKMPIEVNIIDKDGLTLLHHASVHRNVAAARLFLERGVTANSEDEHGDTALHIAVKNRDNDMVQALSARKHPEDPNNMEIYSDLDHINSKTGKGALHDAVLDVNLDIVQTMIQAGADVNLQERRMLKTALYLTVEKFLGIQHGEHGFDE
eukprot:TRINITY_DN8829_c0_g1_i1.p1 TRINITY_DN8829_c0_g1~~TRINITY_DN8829_c0_g1_i1.p1  ORF type:complete len:508 (-),score=99.15 TRINITY_DN8829_c0_g1_i1:160-1683(-)